MCGETFWKRVIVFCLTFGLGVFVSDFFYSTKSNPKNAGSIANSTLKEKNCVPADKNLSYQNLPYYEDEIPTIESEPPVFDSLKRDKKDEIIKPPAKKQNVEKESKAKPQLYVPERDSAEYEILLHQEHCFESKTQK